MRALVEVVLAGRMIGLRLPGSIGFPQGFGFLSQVVDLLILLNDLNLEVLDDLPLPGLLPVHLPDPALTAIDLLLIRFNQI